MDKKIASLILSAGIIAAVFFLTTSGSWANEVPEDNNIEYLKSLSLGELLTTEVTSVSKKSEPISDAAAAVFVITSEDIRRSGATCIPEVLRMVPGLQVARIDANKWAITSRGFNNRFANKLLVLMDGRSVYTPLFSGVYWDVQDTILEDVDRIEVIRGPGATLWGANAVNGVINIITKPAEETQGGLLTAGAGTEERGFGGTRFGGKIQDKAHYRLYAKYSDRDGFVDASDDDTPDDWNKSQAGFRIDWDNLEKNTLTLQGDIYEGDVGQTVTMTGFLEPPFSKTVKDDMEIFGGNVLARWTHTCSATSDMSLQVYYDRTERDELIMEETRDTLDFDFQHRFAVGSRQEIVWGMGYRYTADDTQCIFFNTSIEPDSREDHLFSAFLQDEIMLSADHLWLTLGSKFEHNDYSGLEIQPNARLLWKPSEGHTLWAAVSRAARTPSRADHDVRVNMAAFPAAMGPARMGVMALMGDDDFETEDLTAYELGYRLQPISRFAVDLAAFYNVYDNLRTVETKMDESFLEALPLPSHMVIPLRIDNRMDGETYGVEILANWNVTDNWKLSAGYSWLKVQLHPDDDSLDDKSELAEGDSPEHQFQARSYLNLPYDMEWDTALYFVDNLANQDIPSYLRFDMRLGWQPTQNLELSINGENLFDDRHPEFGANAGINSTEIQRSVYGKITWRF